MYEGSKSDGWIRRRRWGVSIYIRKIGAPRGDYIETLISKLNVREGKFCILGTKQNETRPKERSQEKRLEETELISPRFAYPPPSS